MPGMMDLAVSLWLQQGDVLPKDHSEFHFITLPFPVLKNSIDVAALYGLHTQTNF